LVTHSIEEAVYLADRVFVMTGKNPGTLGASFEVPRPEARRYASSGLASPDVTGFREDPRFQEICGRVRNYLKVSGGAIRP
jgi:ABC-type nitrate/sulfonate/bicarbonate transport system ATPase subunit